jgi:hypothetical protein
LDAKIIEHASETLEAALRAAVDHAGRYDEHAVAAELAFILLRHTDRWDAALAGNKVGQVAGAFIGAARTDLASENVPHRVRKSFRQT